MEWGGGGGQHISVIPLIFSVLFSALCHVSAAFSCFSKVSHGGSTRMGGWGGGQ